MKALLKVFIVLFVFFTGTLFIINYFDLLTIEEIKKYLTEAKEISPLYLGLLVSFFLFLDLFIAVPTLSIIILSGYFLGFGYAFFFSLLGVSLAGISGYLLSYKFGNKFLNFLIKDKEQKKEMITTFNKHGMAMIILSRAMPVLPEASACLSGFTKMKFKKFAFAWYISSIPYILIATYSGSISSIDNPMPAIFTAIGLSLFFWSMWFIYHKKQKKNKS